MGQGYAFRCPQCNYSFSANTGVGFLFPRVYAKTINKARDGKLGATLRDFLSSHPDGALDCSTVVKKCSSCGDLESCTSLDMYLPKAGYTSEEKGRWSVAFPFEEEEYVSPHELKENYVLHMAFPHRCRVCKHTMEPVSIDIDDIYRFKPSAAHTGLECPHCKVPLELTDIIMWD